jgi:thioredoxin 1
MKRRLAIVLLGLAVLTGCEFSFGPPRGEHGGYGIDPVEVTDANFEEVVLGSEQPVMVDCWADWCTWCDVLKPTVHELAADYKGRAVVAQVDTDANQAFTKKYKIEAWPTLLFFKDGELVERVEGVADKSDLAAKLDALLRDSSSRGAE